MKVGVVGASGYVGGETLRLLVNHPEVEISMVTSRQHVGEYLHRVQPGMVGNIHIQIIYQNQFLEFQNYTEKKLKKHSLFHVQDVWQLLQC